MSDNADFSALVRRATERPEAEEPACSPYPYQTRLAVEGLPELLRVPTGAGKTLAAVLPWLYRRRFHPDESVRLATPRWLVVVLPQRSLVEQTVGVIGGWVDRLSLGSIVGVHVLMGGASTDDRAWKMHPADDAVFVGTQDMVLSRLLLRGFAELRASWPVAFGLLHVSTQFVFDEVQLMGPALPTSLQLEGLRRLLGTAAPVRSMWMSATVDPAQLITPDYPGPKAVVELADDDRVGGLRRRLDARRRIERGNVTDDPKRYAREVANRVIQGHEPRTRTIVIANTVERATAIFDALLAASPSAEVNLLHSRFRPDDRQAATNAALADLGPAGKIVVATQVLEAGVDISSRLLVTEVAPWSSIVQRAGRCNRGGEHSDASLVWLPVPSGRGAALPYDERSLAATALALTELEDTGVTSTDLQNRRVDPVPPLDHPVLRRRDLLGLIDTASDLSGNDLDVSQWIRDADARTAAVAWRDLAAEAPPDDWPFPIRQELCAAPIGELATLVADERRRAWIRDQTAGTWERARRGDVRPGTVVVLDASQGGYLRDRGWSPSSREEVSPITLERLPEAQDSIADDPLSVSSGRWVPLAEHLDDVRRDVEHLLTEMGDLPGITAEQREAAALAGLYHDLGKAHPVFERSLCRAASDVHPPDIEPPWAKSPVRKRLRHDSPYFRHELVSALITMDAQSGLLNGVGEPDLVAYLVAAHHGKARLTIRAMPKEANGAVLGLRREEDTLPTIVLPDGRSVPPVRPSLDVLELGAGPAGESWQARACRLRDRADLGPFRLVFLEAIVRMADWRASARYDTAGQETR